MITDIENAAVARLQKARDLDLLGYEPEFDTYPADWDAYLTSKVLRFPAMWVTFGGLTPIEEVGNGVHVEAHFGVIVAAKNLRNETATRQGGPDQRSEPGSYQMVKDVIGLLLGSNLDLSWLEPCRLGSVQFVAATPATQKLKLSMMAVNFATRFVITPDNIDLTGEFLGDFRTFAVDWDLPPITGVDVQDTIQLPFEES